MMHHRGVRDASHRQLIAGFCHALCQPSVRRILHLDDSILATPQRVELLVITELLQRALEVEAQIRLRPAFNGKLAMLDNLTNLQVSFLLGSCSLHDVLPVKGLVFR